MHKLKIIAEVSSNHNKDLERCKRFIRVSKKNWMLCNKISIIQN